MTGDTKERISETALFEAMYNELPRDKKSLRFLSCTMARLKALSGNCLLFNKKTV